VQSKFANLKKKKNEITETLAIKTLRLKMIDER